MDPNKAKVLAFLATQSHGVVSTIAQGSLQPEAALVGFSYTPQFEIIFGNSIDERKYKNIISNQQVAFVFGFGYTTVQYEGIASIAHGDEIQECQAIHFEKHPLARRYAFAEGHRYIKVAPRWIRYRDGTVDPDEIFELNFK
jgi:hypothetical protein